VRRDLQSMVHSLTRWLKRCFILFVTDCKAWALIEGEDLPLTVHEDFFMLSAMFGWCELRTRQKPSLSWSRGLW
jgi:hypothetical protein